MIEIEFDPAKDQVNRRKHGMPLGFAARLLANDPEYEADEDHSIEEARYKAVGFIGERLCICVFTWRGERARIISLRQATRAEREAYANRHAGRGR